MLIPPGQQRVEELTVFPGTTFRYRPDSVLINTPSAYKKVFGPTGNVKKSEYYQGWPRNVNAVNTWSTTNISQHARKRRVMNYAFSENALRAAEGFLHSNTDRWLELLGELPTEDSKWSVSLNMCDWMNWLVFDILGDLCFGKSFDMKEPGSKQRHIPEMMISFLELLHPVSVPCTSTLQYSNVHRFSSALSAACGCGSNHAALIGFLPWQLPVQSLHGKIS